MSQIIDKSLNRFKNCLWCLWTKKKSMWKIFLKFLKTWGKKGYNQNSGIPASLRLCAPVTVSARQGRLNCEAQLITKGMWGSVPTDTRQEFWAEGLARHNYSGGQPVSCREKERCQSSQGWNTGGLLPTAKSGQMVWFTDKEWTQKQWNVSAVVCQVVFLCCNNKCTVWHHKILSQECCRDSKARRCSLMSPCSPFASGRLAAFTWSS